eukprot:6698348-Pyramimonas_sp.AAC.1
MLYARSADELAAMMELLTEGLDAVGFHLNPEKANIITTKEWMENLFIEVGEHMLKVMGGNDYTGEFEESQRCRVGTQISTSLAQVPRAPSCPLRPERFFKTANEAVPICQYTDTIVRIIGRTSDRASNTIFTRPSKQGATFDCWPEALRGPGLGRHHETNAGQDCQCNAYYSDCKMERTITSPLV